MSTADYDLLVDRFARFPARHDVDQILAALPAAVSVDELLAEMAADEQAAQRDGDRDRAARLRLAHKHLSKRVAHPPSANQH